MLLLLLLAACHGQPDNPETSAQRYTCPMHPQIVRDQPGSCPVCNMDLVPKATSAASTAASGDLSTAAQPPNAAVLATLATVRPQAAGAAADTLTLPGTVEYDPRRSRAVAARFGGRIEQLWVRTNYQPVRRGQKLLELYSPELITAEQEFVFVLENEAANSPLLLGAREKLRLLGLTEIQLRDLARTRRPDYRVAVFSPYEGYVVEPTAANAAAAVAPVGLGAGSAGSANGTSGAGMSATSSTDAAMGTATASPAPTPTPPQSAQLTLTEGAYAGAGQTLFQVVNTDQVWGIFQPAPPDLARLRPGQRLSVVADGTGLPPRLARLDLVEPEFRAGASTAAVRVYLPNPGGQLWRGMRLTATLTAAGPAAAGGFWLPRAAVVDLGTRQVAFVRRGAAFVPVAVRVGSRTATQVRVLAGLSGGEDVAANGQYLIDGEGFVQTAANPSSSAAHE